MLPVRLSVALAHTLPVPLPLRLTVALLVGQPLPVAERQRDGDVLGHAELLWERLGVALLQRVMVGEVDVEVDAEMLREAEAVVVSLGDLVPVPLAHSVRVLEGEAVELSEALTVPVSQIVGGGTTEREEQPVVLPERLPVALTHTLSELLVL